MAKCKQSAKRPQPKHKKHKKSQHDKCKRLERPNPKRKKTIRAKAPLTGAMQAMVGVLQAVMDGTSKAPASITTQLPDRPTASGCTDTTGSPWPGWRRIRCGV